MRYGILGALELKDDAHSVQLQTPKQRALLICLLLARNEPVPPDRIVDALWGERPPASAGKLVHVYVSQVRAVLSAGAVETRPAGYLLRVGRDELDADRFERLLAEGREATATGNMQLAASLLRRALREWRGPALHDVLDADFALHEAGRLEELRLDALELRIGADLELGRADDVLPELEALVTSHPLRERLRAHTMLALYRCGRQADALDLYRSTRLMLRDELGLEPGPVLRELEQAILRQDEALAAPELELVVAGRPPTPLTPLVGREHELAELRALVGRPDVRLVTLAGAGGSGKTRLALALANVGGEDFANGCAFVEAAALRDPELVLPTIAQTLGVAEQAGEQVVDALAQWLSSRELLLVLDNLEHLTEVGPALLELLGRASRLTLVTTSRRVLHLSGEHVFPVPPLPEADALELFVQRARAAQRAFVLTAAVEQDIREICRRVDGLPLAIELAAARIQTLTPSALRERLTSRLAFLTGGPKDLPARQQTLHATLAWSTDLLTADERANLASLAVFEGGCSLEAAGAVCGADHDALGTLIDHHLVQRVDSGEETRFGMLETIREHALQLLESDGGRAAVEERHGAYYTRLAEEGAAAVDREGRPAPLLRLAADLANFRAALSYSARTNDVDLELRLCGALWRFWWWLGHLTEGLQRTEAALARSTGAATLARARALRGASTLALRQGDGASAKALGSESAELAAKLGEEGLAAQALRVTGDAASVQGDMRRAAAAYEGSAERFRSLGQDWELAITLMNMGDLALLRGDLDEAESRASESLAYFRETGDDSGISANLGNLAFVALERDELGRAHELLTEGLRRSHALGFGEWVATMLAGLAAVAARAGAAARAAELLGASARLLDENGVTLQGAEARLSDGTMAILASDLGDDALAAALAAGRGITTAEAVALAAIR